MLLTLHYTLTSAGQSPHTLIAAPRVCDPGHVTTKQLEATEEGFVRYKRSHMQHLSKRWLKTTGPFGELGENSSSAGDGKNNNAHYSARGQRGDVAEGN